MRFRRWMSVYGDALLAIGLIVGMLAELGSTGERRPEVGALAVLATGSMAFRRRLPVVSFVVLWAAMLTLGLLVPGLHDNSNVFVLIVFLSLYALGAHARGAGVWISAVLVTIGIGLFVATDGDPYQVADVLFGTVLIGGPWAAGVAIRLRRDRESDLARHAADLTQHAADLERRRAELAEQAVAEERRRIARELHDVVSHAISVTVLHARGGRRLLEADPAEARDAFTVIEKTNAQALGDMRRLLAVLRESDEDGATEAPPSVAMLPSLVTHVRTSGLEVDLDLDGDPSAVPPGIGLSAYRIVQEALTNVLRHAPGARARVSVCCGATDVAVTIVDTGSDGAGTPGSGHGLIGMRERVVVAGGALEAGPAEGGGFRVHARLPYEVAA